MGGCRCYFRNCKVNSYNVIGMHFFRVPIRHKARSDQWVKYAQLKDFYYLPTKRQSNISLCARHFRDECFMNYKKDKLSPSAVPTIHRLSKYDAIDYEPDNVNGVLIKLPEQNAPHLKAPPDYICPLGFEFDAHVSEMLRQRESERDMENVEFIDGCTTTTATGDGEAQVLEITEITALPKTQLPHESLAEEITLRNPIKRHLIHEDSLTEEVVDTNTTKRSKFCRDDINLVVREEPSEYASQPVIINHQIMDNESRMWLSSSDAFNLDDQDDYQFVEIQTDPEQHTRESIQIQHITVSEEDENIESQIETLSGGENDNLLSERLESASIEIDILKNDLSKEREKVEELERSLSHSQEENQRLEQHLSTKEREIQDLKNTNEVLEAKSIESEIFKIQLEVGQEERLQLDKNLSSLREEHTKLKETNLSLNAMLAKAKCENSKLLKEMESLKASNRNDVMRRQEQEQKYLQKQHQNLLHTDQLQKLIESLGENVNTAAEQLINLENRIKSLKTENSAIKTEKLNAEQKILELQNINRNKEQEYNILQQNYETILKTNTKLEADYKMLKNNQNQVSTVTTSATGNNGQSLSSGQVLTKAQLFNGIKRYISASMCSLLRMEMFGSSEREWKPDERQAAVDILRLGESVYKYFTDEWRFRLPSVRDVREWLNQSLTMEDEEDL